MRGEHVQVVDPVTSSVEGISYPRDNEANQELYTFTAHPPSSPPSLPFSLLINKMEKLLLLFSFLPLSFSLLLFLSPLLPLPPLLNKKPKMPLTLSLPLPLPPTRLENSASGKL